MLYQTPNENNLPKEADHIPKCGILSFYHDSVYIYIVDIERYI